MPIDPDNLDIQNNTDDNRFEIEIDGQLALVSYEINGDTITYKHTRVPEAFEGMGIGSKLAQHVLEYAKDEGYKAQVECPFIKSYIERHPEYEAVTP